jgi:hypothetical protein
MPSTSRKKSEDKLLMTLACGASVESAARECNLSARTVYRRLGEPAFRRRLQRLRSDMVQRTAGTLTAASGEAVRTLIELMKSGVQAATRLGAARAVLESGVKLRELAEIEDRLTEMEQRLDQRSGQATSA